MATQDHGTLPHTGEATEPYVSSEGRRVELRVSYNSVANFGSMFEGYLRWTTKPPSKTRAFNKLN